MRTWANSFVMYYCQKYPRECVKSHYKFLAVLLTFRIIRRVGENSGIHTPLDAIKAFDDYTIVIYLDKVFVQKDSPHCMDEFPFAVCEKVGIVFAVHNV